MTVRNKKAQNSKLRRNDEKAKYSWAMCGHDIEFSKKFHVNDNSDIRSFNISFSSDIKKQLEVYTKVFECSFNMFPAKSIERSIEIGIEQLYKSLKHDGYSAKKILQNLGEVR
jgi:hypothetical protein